MADLAQLIAAHQLERITLAQSTATVDEAARALGVAPAQIIKSVVILADGEPLLVIASGNARIDLKRLADHLGVARKRLKLADPATVQALTGYPVGGVPPFGHAQPLRTLVSAAVLTQPVIYGGGGSACSLLRLTPQLLCQLTAAEILE